MAEALNFHNDQHKRSFLRFFRSSLLFYLAFRFVRAIFFLSFFQKKKNKKEKECVTLYAYISVFARRRLTYIQPLHFFLILHAAASVDDKSFFYG